MAHTFTPFNLDPDDDDDDDTARRLSHQSPYAPLIGPTDEPKLYGRRFVGLGVLMLMNVIVSWDWLTFASVSNTSSRFFGVSEGTINWLSIAYMFTFVLAAPASLMALNRGPKLSIQIAAVLIVGGNWLRYAGTSSHSDSGGIFSLVVIGQILIGAAQAFVLTAPTRYSDMWFSEGGRISATAAASISNPLGAAVGQVISPLWATQPSDIPKMVLYTAILSTVAVIPVIFIPEKPPSPSSLTSRATQVTKISIIQSLRNIGSIRTFICLCLPFTIYVGLFNAIATLLNQMMYPYGYTETEAGLCGGILILSGIIAAAITSPIVDRTHSYLLPIRILVPVIALSYLAFTFTPQTRTLVAPYTVAAVIGASSFALLPIVLEYMAEVSWPASPEVSSTTSWALCQLFGSILIIVMNCMKEGGDDVVVAPGGGRHDDSTGSRPPGNMFSALVLQAVIALLAVPIPLALGIHRFGLGKNEIRLRRLENSRLAASLSPP